MDLWDLFEKLYRGRAQKLSFDEVPFAHVDDGKKPQPFEPRQHYIIIRLAEMYVRDQRILWKKFYPMVHSFIRHKPREFSEIAGPGQLKELGTANLDRLVGLAYPLTEPMVYLGTDIDLLVGLYAVPSSDAAKVLLGSLGQLSKLAGLSLDVAVQVANVVKSGVEGLLNIEGNTLQLGVRDTMKPNGPNVTGKVARPEFLLAVNAPAASVDYRKIWVQRGRVLKGNDPISAAPFDDSDYMLIEIERRDTRHDWRALPEVQRHEQAFDDVLSSGTAVQEIKARITKLWATFSLDVKRSDNLTDPDKDRVMASVAEGLRAYVISLEGKGPFEARGLPRREAGIEIRKGFDLLAVQDVFSDQTADRVLQLRKKADQLDL